MFFIKTVILYNLIIINVINNNLNDSWFMFTIILEHDELIIWTQDWKKIKVLILTVVDNKS